jgi:hypothetical protein
MSADLILDIFKYFAKFPDHIKVMANFANRNSKFPGYTDFYNAVNSLTVKNLMPEIKDFIVSISDEKVLAKMRNMNDYFLYIEYGDVSETLQVAGIIRDEQIKLAITVGYKYSDTNNDYIEESLAMNECLKKIKAIETVMNDDNAGVCPFKKYIIFPATTLPIDPSRMGGCLGWVSTFTRQNI